MLIKRQIFSHCKTNNITVFRNQMKHFRQFLHSHLSSASTIADKLRICKISRMKEMFVQYINIEMYKDMVKVGHKGFDFLVSHKCLILHFVIDTHIFQKCFLIMMKWLQSDIQDFIWLEHGISHL